MSIPSLVDGSAGKPQILWSVSREDLAYDEIAGLIDVVAGHKPELLEVAISILWQSRKLETRAVLGVVVASRDPLSQLASICNDALQTRADLDRLIRVDHNWIDLRKAVGHANARACALLNMCEGEIARLEGAPKARPGAGPQARYEAIHGRLQAAATDERIKRGEEIRMFTALRDVHCQNIWGVFESWLERE